MKLIENLTFDEERSFYGQQDLEINNCQNDGPKDGESAFKECQNILINDSYFNLRYPFWHDDKLVINNCLLSDNCRAALWYSNDIKINKSKLYGIKALRESSNIKMYDCDVDSKEFGWFCHNFDMQDTNINSEYFMFESSKLDFKNVTLNGKYSFQYVKDSFLDNCNLNTKDAFWHANNVTIINSTLKGEYLAWYSSNLTLINCKIIGTQPFCYANNLRMIDCEMIDTDLAFEKTSVKAKINSKIDSIKNPKSGIIEALKIDEIILEQDNPDVIIKVME